MSNPFPGRGPKECTPEQTARRARLDARAIEVFGNPTRAGVWCHRADTKAYGRWVSPWELSEESDESLALAMAELERIAPGIVPDYHDPVKAAMRRRKRRR